MDRKPEHLLEDAMIAATARVHDLVVTTGNERDFIRETRPDFSAALPTWQMRILRNLAILLMEASNGKLERAIK